jgi:MtN3 and saliva related transmembrane protein
LSIQLLPQILKAIKTKKTMDLSYLFLMTSIFGSLILIIYGFLIDSVSIIVTIMISLVLKIILILLKIKYDKQQNIRVDTDDSLAP